MSETSAPTLLTDGSARAARTLVLAHGAGAPMDHPWMTTIAGGVVAAADGRVRVVRFEFPYMAARREGRRPGPDRQPVLLDTWRAVVAALGKPSTLVVGGKSMGGRMATMVADELGVSGVVCLGYPFHPPGHPERTRTEHLATLRTPTLILQGERDALGTRDDVARYELSSAITVQWLLDGDHSLKPRRSSGRTEAENLDEAVAAIVAFIGER